MKMGAEEKRKRMFAIVLGTIAGGLVLYQLYGAFSDGTPTPPPAAAVTTAGPRPATKTSAPAKVAMTSAQLDPTLHMGPMLVTESLVYTGSGRNIFSGAMEAPALVAEVKPIASARPGPVTAPTPQVTGPPPLPPINLKFFGTATSANGTRRAFLLNGDDVFVASTGEVVQRRYRVVSITANSVLVEDIPNSNKQTLPLLGAN